MLNKPKIICKSGDADMVWSGDGAESQGSCTRPGDNYTVVCKVSTSLPGEEDGAFKGKSITRPGIIPCVDL